MSAKEKKPLDETVRSIVGAVLLALVLRSFAYEPFHIPSGSMKDTLLIGDYLFVSKYAYGYSRYSFPMGFPFFKGRIMEAVPRQGDIIVFRLPRQPNVDYIKRIIGFPGDRIQMKDGVLHINGQKIEKKRTQDFVDDETGQHVPAYIETLPNGVSYRVLDTNPQGEWDNTIEYVVPPDHYFMMGDNRDNSTDSRVLARVGYVPKENLVGRAELLFFSTDGSARWWQIWKWPFTLREDRFFRSLRND